MEVVHSADDDAREVERLLALVRSHLGMEVAWVSVFAGGQQIIHAADGDTAAMNVPVGAGTDLAGSFCTRVLAGTLPPVVQDARRHPITRELPVTRQLTIGSYAGVPWRGPDGTTAGMLCCVSRTADPTLDEASAVRLLGFAADLIGAHLSGPLAQRRCEENKTAARVRDVLDARAVRMVFQPVVRLTDGESVAFEALARFDRAEFPTPDRAFAAAARSGLGVELEMLAVQRAFEQLPDVPEHAWLGVNLSAEALIDPRVQTMVLAHADRRIGVEVTEHTQVADYLTLLAATERLRAAGVQISVDDAGAGYASFSHILRLKPGIIKLDLDLVRNVDADPVRAALARSLVSFATDIGAELVAEGIETKAEFDRLRELGVDLGQGYYLARPAALPVREIRNPAA